MPLIDVVVAKDLAKQVVNRYLVLHNLPALGVGVIVPSTPKRLKNKERQASWRIGKARLTAWESEENAAIIAPIRAKLEALADARRAYKHALGQVHRYERNINYWDVKISIAINPSTGQLARWNFFKGLAVNGRANENATLPALLAAYNLAKLP